MVTAVAAPSCASVPRLWPGATIVCLATGPSLNAEDVNFCRDRAKVIAIKDAIRLAPWADVLYACGADNSQWWPRHGDSLKAFAGLRYTLDPKADKWATALRNTGETGIEPDPTGLRTGRHSGAQTINLAVHLGAVRIVLLGYDLQPGPDGKDHFFGAHPSRRRPPYDVFLRSFPSLLAPLAALGITLVNATRVSALTGVPRMSLAEALV